MNINVLAIDLAKTNFQLCAVDKRGQIVKEQVVKRDKLLATVEKLSPKVIAMEACGGSNHWARAFAKLSIEVKIIPAYYVKPFVKGNKNDTQDARAIAEAAQRPTMRFVSPKSLAQQDKQSLLRIREGYIEMRTKVSNQVRGLLAEYGIVVRRCLRQLRIALPRCYDCEADNGLSPQVKAMLEMQYHFLVSIDKNIAQCDKQITTIAKTDEQCQRLQQIEGVGELSAVAITTLVGEVKMFKNGRHFAAYLGLVPRQHSSGGKQTLLGISKRGDRYVRSLLIHGGRAVTRVCDNKTDKRSLWVSRIKRERGVNKAAVAVANKNARIILGMLKSGEPYRKVS